MSWDKRKIALLCNCGSDLVESKDVTSDAVTELQGSSHQDLLPLVGGRLHPFNAHIVNVFDGYKLFVECIEIIYQCTMSSRTSEYAAVLFEERFVL